VKVTGYPGERGWSRAGGDFFRAPELLIRVHATFSGREAFRKSIRAAGADGYRDRESSFDLDLHRITAREFLFIA
jgi:hypothetical protein